MLERAPPTLNAQPGCSKCDKDAQAAVYEERRRAMPECRGASVPLARGRDGVEGSPLNLGQFRSAGCTDGVGQDQPCKPSTDPRMRSSPGSSTVLGSWWASALDISSSGASATHHDPTPPALPAPGGRAVFDRRDRDRCAHGYGFLTILSQTTSGAPGPQLRGDCQRVSPAGHAERGLPVRARPGTRTGLTAAMRRVGSRSPSRLR